MPCHFIQIKAIAGLGIFNFGKQWQRPPVRSGIELQNSSTERFQ
jgi:hypothetical protein